MAFPGSWEENQAISSLAPMADDDRHERRKQMWIGYKYGFLINILKNFFWNFWITVFQFLNIDWVGRAIELIYGSKVSTMLNTKWL